LHALDSSARRVKQQSLVFLNLVEHEFISNRKIPLIMAVEKILENLNIIVKWKSPQLVFLLIPTNIVSYYIKYNKLEVFEI
jgi:hypothetical protein